MCPDFATDQGAGSDGGGEGMRRAGTPRSTAGDYYGVVWWTTVRAIEIRGTKICLVPSHRLRRACCTGG